MCQEIFQIPVTALHMLLLKLTEYNHQGFILTQTIHKNSIQMAVCYPTIGQLFDLPLNA